ncbi:hypothetical protein SNEBB_002449 [Seison nebaliae]|nr:hypothetical protein SNEBB_002449 [Seison nebaliae]
MSIHSTVKDPRQCSSSSWMPGEKRERRNTQFIQEPADFSVDSFKNLASGRPPSTSNTVSHSYFNRMCSRGINIPPNSVNETYKPLSTSIGQMQWRFTTLNFPPNVRGHREWGKYVKYAEQFDASVNARFPEGLEKTETRLSYIPNMDIFDLCTQKKSMPDRYWSRY